MIASRKLTAALLAVAAVPVSRAAAQDLRVMSFNIRYATDRDSANAWEFRRDMVFTLLWREMPDVIGLQEALYSQLEAFDAQVPEYGRAGVGRDDGANAGEFSAILYRRDRFSVVESGTFWFSDTPDVPGSRSWGNTITRICTWALLRQRAGGRLVYVFNVHLDHESQPSRERSVAMLLERIAARRLPAVPVIVTGDFNAGEDNPAVRRMVASLRDAWRAVHPGDSLQGTFNAFRGDSTGPRIDYVFTDRFEPREARILRDNRRGRYPSDHFPVIATLAFPVDAPIDAPPVLEGITVTTTRIERRLADEPLRIEVVEEEEIAEKVAMTPGDIAMLLNETGGLRVQSTNASLGRSAVRVQGMLGRYTQVLADGLPLYGEAGALDVMQIPPMDLRQVEVIKGAGSALYGGAALGGLVNLVSRRPDGINEMLVNLTSRGGKDAVFWYSGERTASLLLSGHFQDQRDIDRDGWSDIPRFKRVSVRPRFHFGGDARRTAFLTAGVMYEDRHGGTMPGSNAPNLSPFSDDARTTRVDAAGSVSWQLENDWLVRARASFLHQDRERNIGSVLDPELRRSGLAEFTVGRRRGTISWLAGAAVNVDDLRADSSSWLNYTNTAPGVFGQVEWDPSRGLGFSASARWDHHSRYGDFFSPRLSVVARPSAVWTIRASAGSGYFAPTPFIEEVDAVGLRAFQSPLSVAPERGASASLDVGALLGTVELNASLFATRLDHQVFADIYVSPSDGAIPLHRNSAGRTSSAGVDLVAKWRRGPVTVTGAYTFVEATREQFDGFRETVPLNPRHQAGLVAMYDGEKLRLGWELYIVGEQALDDNEYRTTSQGYAVTGLLVQRRFGSVTAFLNFENLLDARMTRWQPLVRTAYSPTGAWTTDAWAPLEGRTVNGGVRLPLKLFSGGGS